MVQMHKVIYRAVFNFLCQLTTWHCTVALLLNAVHCATVAPSGCRCRYFLPAGPTAANLLQCSTAQQLLTDGTDRQCTVTCILTHTMQALSIIHKTAHLASGRHTAACNTLDDSVGAAIIRVVASINNTLRHDTMLQRHLYTFYCWRLAQVRRHFCKTCKWRLLAHCTEYSIHTLLRRIGKLNTTLYEMLF